MIQKNNNVSKNMWSFRTLCVFLIAFVIIADVYYYFFYPKVFPNVYKTGDIQKIKPVYMNILPTADIFVGQSHFTVELARSSAEQALGLGKRGGLNPDSGMLFIFSKPSIQNFWMKDMEFPIDMVWIDENKKVIGFAENALPEDFPKVYSSPKPASYVLEIGAGQVKIKSIQVGDEVNFDLSGV